MNRESGTANGGFTMIELMVAVVVLGILLALAVPSFLGLLRDARRSSAVNDLLADMTFARSEAARRGRDIVVCSNVSSDSCGATTNWGSGWIVFEDTNGNGAHDSTASEAVIRRAAGRSADINVLSNASVYRFPAFNQRGTAGRVTFCDARDAGGGAVEHSRSVVVATSGRARVEKTIASGTCP